MNQNRDQKQDLLKELLNGQALETFDVRAHVFAQVEEDSRHSKNKNWKRIQEFECDKSVYDNYQGPNELLIKTAIGKKWACTFNYDYDAALISNLVYQKVFLPAGVIKPLGSIEKYEYVITCDDRCFRGDTMNSWAWTLNKFVRTMGEEYVCGWNEEARSNPQNYKKEFPSYITEFMKVVYTVGNFIPVPHTPNFNTGRSKLCHDYWDLTLLEIYRYYKEGIEGASNGWKELFSQDGVEHWLKSFGSWPNFVKINCMQAFVEENCGKPLPLWTGHFESSQDLPQNKINKEGKTDFEEFFVNATQRIKERSEEIAKKLREERCI